MGEYEVRDNWGRRIGTARPIGQDSGCSCLVLLAAAIIAVIVGIIFLFQGLVNLAIYHTFSPNFPALTATAIAPYHYKGSAVSAKKSGKVSPASVMGEQAVELGSDGSITFNGIDLSEAGSYYLCIYGEPNGGAEPVMIDITSNKNLIKVDANKSLNSSSPTSCVSDIGIDLNAGSNSIQISVDKNNYCFQNGGCPTVDITEIEIIKKS